MRRFFSLYPALCAGALLLNSCLGEETRLRGPQELRLAAAKKLRARLPGVRVFFSQNTGAILSIDLAGKGTSGLAAGSVRSREDALALVRSFLDSNPALFGIDETASSLQIEYGDFRTGAPERGGLSSLRFEQYYDGLPLKDQYKGRYGVALFGDGKLLAIHARLTPTAELRAAKAKQPGTGRRSQTLTGEGPGPRAPVTRSSERRFLDLAPDGGLRVLLERVERTHRGLTRELRDEEGRLLSRIDEFSSALGAAPSNWEETGTPVERPAHDSFGNVLAIPSTQVGSQLVLGFRLGDVLEPGAGYSIADASLGPDPGYVPDEPITTDAADWLSEPSYDGALRDATRLALNLRATLHWFKDRLGFDSWNGQGAPLRAAIRGSRRIDHLPDLNAYGYDGTILIGSGRTKTGQALGDALDVVAHEFMHSVIGATAGFQGFGEPGALTESLADVFGVSVEGFDSPLFGDGAGHPMRDLLNPSAFGLPESYADYRELENDGWETGAGPPDATTLGQLLQLSHANSGIMSRALTLAITDLGNDGHVTVTRLLLDALRDVAFSDATSLEEFAAGVSAYCRARGEGPVCERLDAGFQATELLRHVD